MADDGDFINVRVFDDPEHDTLARATQTLTQRAKLRRETLDLVEQLVKENRISSADAELFKRVATVWAAIKTEDTQRELQRYASQPWWKRWLSP